MHKINGPGATPTQEFTEGNPGTGTPATTVTAEHMNTVQRELVALVQGSGQTLNPNDQTQVLQAVQLLIASGGGGGGGADGKNELINGDFGLQQRLLSAGTFGLTNASAYTFDRWVCSADAPGSGAGTAVLSRVAHTVGQTDVPGARHFLRWNQTVAATAGSPRIAQRVEDVTRYGAGKLCQSLYIKGSAALAGVLRISQVFGTGGSPSATVLIASANISITTSWQRVSDAVDITTAGFALLGKTLGTDGNSHLLVELWMPQGSTFTIDMSDWQLERNLAPTAFARRSPGEERRRALRYYERSGSPDFGLDTPSQFLGMLTMYTFNSGSAAILAPARFQVTKFKQPTVRWWNPLTGSPDKVNWASERNVTTTDYVGLDQPGYAHVDAAPTPGTAGLFYGNWEADAEL